MSSRQLLRIHLLFGRLLDQVTSAEKINDSDYLMLALIALLSRTYPAR